MVLIEDPQTVTLQQIVAEAAGQLATTNSSAIRSKASPSSMFLSATSNALPKQAQLRLQREPAATSWVAPAPFSVKMRVFCLPYAGGVSENVYGRCVSSRGQNPNIE